MVRGQWDPAPVVWGDYFLPFNPASYGDSWHICLESIFFDRWHFWLDLYDVSLPSHRWTNGWQPLKKHCYQWLDDRKPLRNHWSQWLSRYHSINGNGHPKHHWFFAMVVNFLPLCLAEADIKQTNDSFWKLKKSFYSVLTKLCLDLCPPVYL